MRELRLSCRNLDRGLFAISLAVLFGVLSSKPRDLKKDMNFVA